MTLTHASGSWAIGTDVGGTFTDLWLRSPDGDSWVCKSPTTSDVVTGVVNAVHLAADTVGPADLRTEFPDIDADLVLGVLDPAEFGSGGIVLDRAAAAAAIEERIGKPLGLSAIEAARAIRVVFDNAMADLLRAVTIERGHDPREFTLVAGGGSGPSHAWALCRETGLPGFIVPPTATAASAFGAGTCDLKTTASRTSYRRILPEVGPRADDVKVIEDAASQTRRSALATIPDPDNSQVTTVASIRYFGQTHHLDIPLPDVLEPAALAALLDSFESEYEKLWGKGAGFKEAGFEILSVRSIAALPARTVGGAGRGEPFTMVGSRPVVFDDPQAPDETDVYEGRWPAPDQHLVGPALIHLPGCVVVIPPGATATTDDPGLIHVKVN